MAIARFVLLEVDFCKVAIIATFNFVALEVDFSFKVLTCSNTLTYII